MPALYDVAIVGFGPTGAVAAGLLAQAGHAVYVCDQRCGVYEIPRAIALDHEIMRLFQQLRVVDAVLPHCEPFTPSEYFGVDGQLIRRMTMVDPPYPQGYTPSMVFTQPEVERVLRAGVAALPQVHVAEGVRCTALTQDGDGVTLTVDGQPVRARWAIGCDGGGSTIRTLLDIGLEDLNFDEPWLVVDVLCNAQGLAKLPKTSVQYCEPERPCTFVIGPQNHRRWEISINPGEDPAQLATPEGTWALLQRFIGKEDGELWRQSSYRFHALVAEQWQRGRVFLAGDAAHMQPPFLGQGMCQGLRDASNLCWKLSAVLRGRVQGEAAEVLLAGYQQERKGHVRELTSRIKALGAVICERDVDKARARDAELLAACGGHVRDTPRQDILPALSAGCITATPGAGTLFPQPRLDLGSRGAPDGLLMDEVYGHGFRLVSDGMLSPGVWSGATIVDLSKVHETGGVVAGFLARYGVHAALVRPDHYVMGTAADNLQLAVLEQQYRMLFG